MPLPREKARATYDRLGNALDRMERFESRAKALGLAWLDPRPGERVAELGVGTGRMTVQLLERVGPTGVVDGVDVSPHMLELTRDRAMAAGLNANLTLREAPADDTGLADAAIDALYTSYVLDLLPEAEIDAAAREAWRVLRPGGRAVFVGMTPGRSILSRSLTYLWGLAHALRPKATGG